MSKTAASIDSRNREYWNELCGTQLAKSLGVTDGSPSSLKRFDDWYMNFYPYLRHHIPFGRLSGKMVLEVGLGYGTVTQKLAEAGANYHGLDIAEKPVQMANHRLRQMGLAGDARKGSILAAPYGDEVFDIVVAIGCYHHTGNLKWALDETWRMLKPGGEAILMVYYSYSYRRWLCYPCSTLRYFLWDKFDVGTPLSSSEKERAHYDTGAGGAAPETVFVSGAAMDRMTRHWSSRAYRLENIGAESLLKNIPRKKALHYLGPWIGLDLYCHLIK